MNGRIYRADGEFFVDLLVDGELVDVAGPFEEEIEAYDVGRRYADELHISGTITDGLLHPGLGTVGVGAR